ncbi:MAG: DUF427 domain-containing protein [Rhizobiaceae bacterium]
MLMLQLPENTYRLKVEPAGQRITAHVNGHLAADSSNARIMRETRLAPTVYFPRDDVFHLDENASEFRTFCPFKGTAEYHDLILPEGRISNATWCYPRTLKESEDIMGMVAFDPRHAILSPELADTSPIAGDGNITSPFVDWLLREAWVISDPAELTRQIAHRLIAAGVAVWRLNILIWSLHPQTAGIAYVWKRDDDSLQISEPSYETLETPAFINSPLRYVAHGLGGVRQNLTADQMEFSFPIMDELRAGGATDYVAMPLRFSDGRIHVLTLATDHPDGFTTANLGMIFECSAVISRYYEVHMLRSNARNVLGTYLGKRTGERVLGGEIRRGDGEDVDAAIVICDMRQSSILSEQMERDEYLDLLNRFFETVTGAVEKNGGEVLKFVGDAVLAIFPSDAGEAAACRSALKAACEAVEAVSGIEFGPGNQRLACSAGAAFGRVSYGNVGSATRLDFTVTGTATNIAARLCDLAKHLDRDVLVSTEYSHHHDQLESTGSHELRNVGDSVEAFTPRPEIRTMA